MTSPTQTVVGKGNSNPLIAEGLLKILKAEMVKLQFKRSTAVTKRDCSSKFDCNPKLDCNQRFDSSPRLDYILESRQSRVSTTAQPQHEALPMSHCAQGKIFTE
jgi:hypothetical protein